MKDEQDVVHNPGCRRFETTDGAFLEYVLDGDVVIFANTYTPPELRGQGHASRVTRAALDHARSAAWRVVPACFYVDAYIRRHRDYADLMA